MNVYLLSRNQLNMAEDLHSANAPNDHKIHLVQHLHQLTLVLALAHFVQPVSVLCSTILINLIKIFDIFLWYYVNLPEIEINRIIIILLCCTIIDFKWTIWKLLLIFTWDGAALVATFDCWFETLTCVWMCCCGCNAAWWAIFKRSYTIIKQLKLILRIKSCS